jgi:hypothetical protein
VAGSQEWDAPLRCQMCITFCGCWPCGVGGICRYRPSQGQIRRGRLGRPMPPLDSCCPRPVAQRHMPMPRCQIPTQLPRYRRRRTRPKLTSRSVSAMSGDRGAGRDRRRCPRRVCLYRIFSHFDPEARTPAWALLKGSHRVHPTTFPRTDAEYYPVGVTNWNRANSAPAPHGRLRCGAPRQCAVARH